MNTLWIFGDSFSWDCKIKFNTNGEVGGQIGRYITKYLDGVIFESWGEILATNLNLNYINHATYQTGIKLKGLSSGNSNNANINLINELSPNFKKGDIVIFGFTDVCRFDWVSEENEVLTLGAANYNINTLSHKQQLEQNLINKIIVRRDSSDFFKLDILQKLKAIETLSDLVGFELWYWDWTGGFDSIVHDNIISKDKWIFFQAHPNYINYSNMMWNDYKVGSISWETNNRISDGHMGKIGNAVHGKILSEFLSKRL